MKQYAMDFDQPALFEADDIPPPSGGVIFTTAAKLEEAYQLISCATIPEGRIKGFFCIQGRAYAVTARWQDHATLQPVMIEDKYTGPIHSYPSPNGSVYEGVRVKCKATTCILTGPSITLRRTP
jgi:hypothetical protein